MEEIELEAEIQESKTRGGILAKLALTAVLLGIPIISGCDFSYGVVRTYPSYKTRGHKVYSIPSRRDHHRPYNPYFRRSCPPQVIIHRRRGYIYTPNKGYRFHDTRPNKFHRSHRHKSR